MQESNYNDAIQAYTEAIKLDPNHHVYHSNRSAAYFSIGDYEKSVSDAAECVSLAPTWSKGYNRLATSLLKLDRTEEASKISLKGLEIDPSNTNLSQTLNRIKRIQVFQILKGKWHGAVNEAVGGYVQEFDFINDEDVLLSVLGNQVNAKYEINAGVTPGHLDMNVPLQPHLPTVRHIYKFDKYDTETNLPNELHLCSPYLTDPNSRPTTFTGPAYVIMRRGGAAASADELKEIQEVAKLGEEEKMALFLKEAIEFTPTIFCLPFEGDPDQVLSEKMTASVKFQSRYQKARNKYGDLVETIVKQMVIGEIKPPSAEVQDLVTKFRDKMNAAGLFGSPQEAQELAAAAAARQESAPAEPKLSPATAAVPLKSLGEETSISKKEVKPSKGAKGPKSDASTSSDTTSYYLSLAVIGVCIGVAVAGAAYLSSKQNSRR